MTLPPEAEAMVARHFACDGSEHRDGHDCYHCAVQSRARALAAELLAERDAEVERLRAVLERISALGKKRAPVLDEDADYDDCVDYGKAMGAFTAAAIARAALTKDTP